MPGGQYTVGALEEGIWVQPGPRRDLWRSGKVPKCALKCGVSAMKAPREKELLHELAELGHLSAAKAGANELLQVPSATCMHLVSQRQEQVEANIQSAKMQASARSITTAKRYLAAPLQARPPGFDSGAHAMSKQLQWVGLEAMLAGHKSPRRAEQHRMQGDNCFKGPDELKASLERTVAQLNQSLHGSGEPPVPVPTLQAQLKAALLPLSTMGEMRLATFLEKARMFKQEPEAREPCYSTTCSEASSSSNEHSSRRRKASTPPAWEQPHRKRGRIADLKFSPEGLEMIASDRSALESAMNSPPLRLCKSTPCGVCRAENTRTTATQTRSRRCFPPTGVEAHRHEGNQGGSQQLHTELSPPYCSTLEHMEGFAELPTRIFAMPSSRTTCGTPVLGGQGGSRRRAQEALLRGLLEALPNAPSGGEKRKLAPMVPAEEPPSHGFQGQAPALRLTQGAAVCGPRVNAAAPLWSNSPAPYIKKAASLQGQVTQLVGHLSRKRFSLGIVGMRQELALSKHSHVLEVPTFSTAARCIEGKQVSPATRQASKNLQGLLAPVSVLAADQARICMPGKEEYPEPPLQPEQLQQHDTPLDLNLRL